MKTFRRKTFAVVSDSKLDAAGELIQSMDSQQSVLTASIQGLDYTSFGAQPIAETG
jgi:hypothetical protein